MPIDWNLPIEDEQGRPCRLNWIDGPSCYVVDFADNPGNSGNFFNALGFREGECTTAPSGQLRNVGATVESLPAWKAKAILDIRQRDPVELVPWQDADWRKAKAEAGHHFEHLEVVDGVPMVAFYQTERHAEAGRKTKMRPGRYLTRFFGDVLNNDMVEALTADVTVQAGAMDVRWTQDADEIEEIYVNGPNSCMSSHASAYNGHCHPSRVYAGPDLAVAWLGEQDDPTARAIVWPDRKVYGGVYGDVSRMHRLLEAKGFQRAGQYDAEKGAYIKFDGARIRRIEDRNGNGLIMPYLDIADGADDDGEFVILGQGGHVETSNTCGTSDDNRRCCSRCDDYVSEESMNYIEDEGEDWCDHCVEAAASYCDYRSAYVAGEVYEVHGSRRFTTVSEARMEAAGFVYVEDRAEWWAVDCTFTCDDCGEVFHEDDRDGRDTGADVCTGCADDRAEQGDDGNTYVPGLATPDMEAVEAAGQMRLPLPLPVASNEGGAVLWRVYGKRKDSAEPEFEVCTNSPNTDEGEVPEYRASRERCEVVIAGLSHYHDRYDYRLEPVMAEGGLNVRFVASGEVYAGRLVETDADDGQWPFRVEARGTYRWVNHLGMDTMGEWDVTGLPEFTPLALAA